MNKFIILTRVLLKGSGDSLINTRKNAKIKLPRIIALGLIMAILIMSLGIPFGMLVSAGYDALAPIHQEGILLAMGFAIVSLMIFMFGIFYVIGVFYFSKDIESLLPLPLTSSQILGAKFTVVLIYEYFTEIVFLAPVIIAFGIKSGGGVLYYIYALLVFLVLPMIPLIFASLISLVIMRFTNLAKNKDRFRIVGGILAMFVALGVNFGIQRFTQSTTNQDQLMRMLMEGNNSMVSFYSKIFPGSKWAAESLIRSSSINGLLNLLLFIVVTAVLFLVFMLLAEGLYFKGVIGFSEAASKRKVLSGEEMNKNLIQNSGFKSYLFKEFKILFRTPAYFMNCVLMNFLWPIFILFPMLAQPQAFKDIQKLTGVIKEGRTGGIVVAGAFAFVLFIAVSNGITSTSISREGQNIFVSKYIPLSYGKQLMAKITSALLLNCISLVMLLALAFFLIKLPLSILLTIGVEGIAGILFVSFTGIMIDLYMPKLNWDNEQKAVKQNFNVIFNMLLGFVFGGLTVFAIVMLHLEFWVAFAVIIILYGILDVALYYVLNTTGVKLYGKIEV